MRVGMAVRTAARDDAGTVQSSDRVATFSDCYDRTCALAFGLALHVTGDDGPAHAACERAYLRAWREQDFVFPAFERFLLEAVRRAAVELCPPFPSSTSAPWTRVLPVAANGASTHGNRGPKARRQFAALEPEAKLAIELAYFRCIGASEIAGFLGQPVEPVRAAMRNGLLQFADGLRAPQAMTHA